ncbi:hypothetical protein BDF22DRAFT_619020 [Syncephalis plumigaleata]|nr:hypothetical protein BDF22DRAFT_619020 [Syncephalis plumigaleata]
MGWFGKSFSNKQIPSLTGKVAVVTGANTGIGYHIALQLAKQGCRVYVACRNQERALAAIENIKSDIKTSKSGGNTQPDLKFLALNLNNLAQVDRAAKEMLAAEPRIHILINNAGVMALPYTQTDDHIESQFGVNHIGPTLFTQRLLPTIRQSGTTDDPARIVFTSSLAHQWTYKSGVYLDLKSINEETGYSPMKAYGQSKLANIMTASYLARQVAKEDGAPTVLINSLHPGVVHSDLGRNFRDAHGWIVDQGNRLFYWVFAMSTADGALTSLYAATSNEVKEKGYNGQFFIPYGKRSTPSSFACNEELQDKLWSFTQSIIDEKLKQ